MASALAVLIIIAAGAALVAWFDFTLRNIDDALGRAIDDLSYGDWTWGGRKENPDTGSRGGRRNKRHQGLGTQHTSSDRTAERGR